MNIHELKDVLLALVRHNGSPANGGGSEERIVPMIWGDPGLGKTETVEALAAELGWPLVQADLQTRDPAELGGMPWVEGGRSVRCRPDWLPPEGEGILFLDELPQAGAANLNTAAQLVREHRIGEHRLAACWQILCAGNHLHNRAGGVALPSQLRNRLLHLRVDADVGAWARWAHRSGLDPMLIAYNRYRPDFHHAPSATEQAFPTPRSWALVDRIQKVGLDERLRSEAIEGAVGAAARADYQGFLEIAVTMPDPDAIIADPDRGPLPLQPQVTHALMGALAGRATQANFASIQRYLARLPEQEWAAVCITDATARQPELMSTAAYQRWAVASGRQLSAA